MDFAELRQGLSASTLGTALLDFFALRSRDGLYHIAWDRLDITDPAPRGCSARVKGFPF
ncbi:hypothetical protein [Mesorhizobium sp.]|uniref:hypothetical protein n=1 Tax=Mesorhizobium sp. TaxID=1871066 RepID=UPI0025EFDBBB|nr:hypothetical protein [Mesorhizobium sp.]